MKFNIVQLQINAIKDSNKEITMNTEEFSKILTQKVKEAGYEEYRIKKITYTDESYINVKGEFVIGILDICIEPIKPPEYIELNFKIDNKNKWM